MRGIDILKPCIVMMIRGEHIPIMSKDALPVGFPNYKEEVIVQFDDGESEEAKAYCPFEITAWLLEEGYIDDLFSEIHGHGNVVKGPWSGA